MKQGFLEADKIRLAGDTKRQATLSEVHDLKNENVDLKQLVTELSFKNQMKKKSEWYRLVSNKYMRSSKGEKMEIIRLVQDLELGVKRTLEKIGISSQHLLSVAQIIL